MNTRRGGTDPFTWIRASAPPSAGTILAQRRQGNGWTLFQVADAAIGLDTSDVYRIEQGLCIDGTKLAAYSMALSKLEADPPCMICHVAHSSCHPEDCAGHLLAVGRGEHR